MLPLSKEMKYFWSDLQGHIFGCWMNCIKCSDKKVVIILSPQPSEIVGQAQPASQGNKEELQTPVLPRPAVATLDPSPTGQRHSRRGHVHGFPWKPLGAVSYLDWGPCSPKLPNSCPETSPVAPPFGSGPSVLPSGAPSREIRPVPFHPSGAAFTALALSQSTSRFLVLRCLGIASLLPPEGLLLRVLHESPNAADGRGLGLLPEFQSTSGATACWQPLRAGSCPWVLPLISAYSMVCSCNNCT